MTDTQTTWAEDNLRVIRTLVERTVTTADAVEAEMLKGDTDDPYWDGEGQSDE